MTAPNKMAKRAAAGTLALAVCFTGGLVAATSASAAPGFKFDTRISGPDRTATAIAAAEAAFGDGSETVIIVERDAVVDGLTASYAAGLNKAPILYVDRQGVPDNVAAEIKKLGAKKAILVGGKAVLPEVVQKQLESAGLSVTRQAGPDRYATAAEVALSGSKTPDKVLIASGETPADALAAGPIAYAKNYPLVLVRPDLVPDSSRDALDKLGSGERLAIGGTVRISQGVYDSLGQSKRRISGANRQATAIEIAKVATGELGFQKDRVALVSDADRAAVDALVASPVAGSNLAPLLFISGSNIGSDTEQYLKDHAAELTGPGYIFGGTAAVPQAAADAGAKAAGGDEKPSTSNETLAVTPTDAVTLPSSLGTDDTATPEDETKRGQRTYTVKDLDDKKTYTIALFPAKSVRASETGVVTFLNDSTTPNDATDDDLIADYTAPTSARIVGLNNAVIASPTASGIQKATPVAGTLLFTVNSEGADDVVPVVFVNEPGQTSDTTTMPGLDLKADGTPTEKFGIGGATKWTGVELTTGTAVTASTPITAVDKAAHTLTTGTGSSARVIRYDDNDVLSVDTGGNVKRVTVAQLDSVLSRGDMVEIAADQYFQNSAFSSTIKVTNAAPVAPTLATAVGSSENRSRATVSITPATVAGVTVKDYQFVIQRARGNFNEVTVDDFSTVATINGTEDADASTTAVVDYYDKNLAPGFYTYRVQTVLDGDKSEFTAAASTSTQRVLAPSSDTTRPTLLSTTKSGTAAFTTGDTITLDFSEAVAASAADVGAAIRFTDPDGEVFQVKVAASGTAAGTATATRTNTPAANNKPAVTNGRIALVLLAAPVKVGGQTPATNPGDAQVPATITAASTGFADAAGNLLDLAGSSDVIIDVPFN